MSRVHGGNLLHVASEFGIPVESLVDYSAGINPLGPPAWFRQVISRNLEMIARYPDPRNLNFRHAAADFHGVTPGQVVAGNGASELIFVLPRLFGIRRALIPVPSYGDYMHACHAAGVKVESVHLRPEDDFRVEFDAVESRLLDNRERKTMVWLGQPNNPTGMTFETDRFAELCRKHSECVFVVDESFADYVEGYASIISLGLPNVVVLRSLTKFYGVPGLRIGYAVSNPDIVGVINDTLPTWSVNAPAQTFAVKALGDVDYQVRSREFMTSERRRFALHLAKIPGITVFESEASFLLLRIAGVSSADFHRRLLEVGFVVRTCDDFAGLGSEYVRIAVRTDKENDRLCAAMQEVLSPKARVRSRRKRKRAARLMIQGTASNAGKSVVTAAMCRILLKEGVRVAPFKAQNMSLNSYVTADGGEMGRAQVVQAQACRIDPDVRMNPVLLKPGSNTGSQVILRGKPIGFMEAGEYYADKTRLFREVTRCFDDLAGEYDAVVIEGAGSPGEVNLKKNDIVNMRMAAYAEAPVLLVGDIDRGGVFASFVGTLEVLEEWERKLIRGFLINKFRGDVDLLEPAIAYTFDHTGKPTLGIIPMIRDLSIPDEDSVGFKTARTAPDHEITDDSITIGLVDLPHISNFTDFDPLENEPDVNLRVVRHTGEIDGCDAIVIPGSKNVFADLRYLKETGIASRIVRAAEAKECTVIGICGGYQMLGRSLSDPRNVESTDGTVSGLGLLAVDTVLGKDKILGQTSARHLESGLKLQGYEIHHGRTVCDGMKPWIERSDAEIIGVSHPNVEIHGTYLHGVFDADEFRRWFLDRLRVRKGLAPLKEVMYVHDIEPSLDNLAAIVRDHVDLGAILRIMGL